jgi:hypothetical protein
MSTTTDSTLVIVDGGLSSLLACWTEGVCRPATAGAISPASPAGERSAEAASRLVAAALSTGTVAWCVPGISEPAHAAASRFVETCQLSGLITPKVAVRAHGELPRKLQAGLSASELLIAACIEALRRDIHRVIWPIQLGGANVPTNKINTDELDQVADAFDRALLTSRLMAIDAGPRGLVIETPYIDFRDAQLMDLAADMDAPINLAWWCDQPVATPGALGTSGGCGACPSCLRWSQAMLEAGLHSTEAQGLTADRTGLLA